MSYGLIRRLSPAARSAVIAAPLRSARPSRLADIERGWVVVDLGGHQLGRVDDVADSGLVVNRGFVRRRIRVPADRIAELRAGTVRLSITRDEGLRG